MPTWDSRQYLQFNAQRTRPAQDLAARTEIEAPRRVIDLGCGPGNSTAVVSQRWPQAAVTGIDSSPDMIAAARRSSSNVTWEIGDIGSWSSPEPFDVVFSNAALQWVPNHRDVLPKIVAQVGPGGAFAFQVPANFDAAGHRLIREIGASSRWRDVFKTPVREWHVDSTEFYYETLAPLSTRLDVWLTDYIHVMPALKRSWSGTAEQDFALGWMHCPMIARVRISRTTTWERLRRRFRVNRTGASSFPSAASLWSRTASFCPHANRNLAG
jgi:trans-aconitate 2-methyltransferase